MSGSDTGTRRRLKRLGQVLGVLLLCLVVGELSLRLFHYFSPSFIFEPDSFLRFRGRPNGPNYDGRLNSHGFNDREHPVDKPAGGYRILALGDSFVFGVVPYRGNFVTLLEERLVSSGRSAEVINLGIPGTNPEHHPRLLTAYGLSLDPDAVLQFVYVGNDLGDLTGQVERRRWTPFTLDLARFLFGVLPDYEGTVFHKRAEYQDEAPTFSAPEYADLVRRHADVFDPTWPEFSWRLERLRVAFRRTAEICRERGLGAAVVLMPADIQVNPELAGRLGTASRLDLEWPNRALREALEEDGVPYLDLLPAFVEAAGGRRLYKRNDTHWNLAGNRLAAQRIYDWLDEGGSGLGRPPPRPD